MASSAVGVEDLLSGSDISGESGGDGNSGSDGGTGNGGLDGLLFIVKKSIKCSVRYRSIQYILCQSHQHLPGRFELHSIIYQVAQLTEGTSTLGAVKALAEAIRAAMIVYFILDSC